MEIIKSWTYFLIFWLAMSKKKYNKSSYSVFFLVRLREHPSNRNVGNGWPEYSPLEGSWLCKICRWREPVPTRVLNPNASEASYKPKLRSYRKTWGGNFPGGSISRTEKVTTTNVLELHYLKLFVCNYYGQKILENGLNQDQI